MKKIIIGFLLTISISFSSDTFNVHVGNCALHIPNRYQLRNNFTPPSNFNFYYLENTALDELQGENFLLRHNINIHDGEISEKHKSFYLNKFKELLHLIKLDKYKNMEIWHFKSKNIDFDKNGTKQDVAQELNKQANTFLIFSNSFNIYIEETDPYIDEIYNMIKDCK